MGGQRPSPWIQEKIGDYKLELRIHTESSREKTDEKYEQEGKSHRA